MRPAEQIIARTVAGFLDAEGGTLHIGVNDDGVAVGVERDFAASPPGRGRPRQKARTA
jgi:hypothetical protein